MEKVGITAKPAGDMKCSPEVRESVIKALYHLERMACRMGEIPLEKDLRHPMHESFSRLWAAIYEIQAIIGPAATNHKEVIDDATLFDDIEVVGMPIVVSLRKGS
jgi:Mn2+/Fe2+ NRAMP family transporter